MTYVLRSFLAIAALLLVAFGALSRPLRDFVEYWTVSHLLVQGGHCYSLTEVFFVEKALGFSESVPLMVVNPPWILPLIAPLGFLRSYPLAWMLWMGMSASILCISSWILLEIYAPNVRLREVSDGLLTRSLFIFSFFPTLLLLRFGQITVLVLLGLCGFLWFQPKRPLLAGCVLSLAALKPHLVYLVLCAVFIEAIYRRSFKVLVGFLGTILGLSAIAEVLNPGALAGYYTLSHSPYVHLYPSALGLILRLPFPPQLDTFSLQFVPPACGTIWFVFYWIRHRRQWQWTSQMPIVVTASVLTAAYGWLFDQVLLAIPVVAIFAALGVRLGRLPAKAVWIYTALNFVLVVGSIPKSFPPLYLIAPIPILIMLRGGGGDASGKIVAHGVGRNMAAHFWSYRCLQRRMLDDR